MNLKRILPLVVLFIATYASAQTTYSGTVSPFNCGRISSFSCWGIPMLVYDGDELVNESVWVSYYGTPYYVASNFLTWPTDPLGLNSTSGYAKFTSLLPTLSTAPGTQSLVMTFAGVNKAGDSYTGVFNFTYTTYYSAGGGGRGGAGAGWRWVITGGTVSITIN